MFRTPSASSAAALPTLTGPASASKLGPLYCHTHCPNSHLAWKSICLEIKGALSGCIASYCISSPDYLPLVASQPQILCWSRRKTQAMTNCNGSRVVASAWATQVLCSEADGQAAPALLPEQGDTFKDCGGSIHSCPAQVNQPDELSLHSNCTANIRSARQAEASRHAQVTSVQIWI